MAYTTDIGWTEATWNPWMGCRKVSPGCKYCYMYRDMNRYKKDPTQIVESKDPLKPLTWKLPRLIFVCSWSDFFIEEADQWREQAWDVMRKTPQHTYQIVTKRPERIKECLPSWGIPDNVWLGVSVEGPDQLMRVDFLDDMKALFPTLITWVSFEPLLEEISETDLINYCSNIDWAVIGGESGNEAGKYLYRKCKMGWIRSMAHTLQLEMGVSVFVKQVGSHIAKKRGYRDRHGKTMSEWPKSIQIQEWP